MPLQMITPPMVPAVSLQEAKKQCRVEPDDNTEDDILEAYIDAATRRLDGEAGFLGRCLIEQEWRLTLDRFPQQIRLPLPPTMSVDRITYRDAAGEEQILDAAAYRVTGLNTMAGASILPSGSWPAATEIAVEFTAGFGSDAASIPEPIRQAIRLHVAAMYQMREAVTLGSGFMTETPMGWEDLVADYRMRTF